MHGARAAQRHAAAELRAGHAKHVAQDPEQRRVAIDIDAVCVAVDFDGEGHGVFSFLRFPSAFSQWAEGQALVLRCHADRVTRTSAFPKLRPSSTPMKAAGACSRPSVMSSR